MLTWIKGLLIRFDLRPSMRPFKIAIEVAGKRERSSEIHSYCLIESIICWTMQKVSLANVYNLLAPLHTMLISDVRVNMAF